MEKGIKFSVNIDRLFRYHLIGIFLLVLIDALSVAVFELHGFGIMKGLMPLFNLDDERNLPSLFSAAAFLLLSGACLLCTKAALKEDRKFWKAMALIFLFLSVDEAVSIHEKISLLLKEVFHLSNAVKTRAWVVPYGIAASIFAVLTLPPLVRLPANTRYGLVVAGSVYVTGAIGFEIVEAIAAEYGTGAWMSKRLTNSLCVLCEESLEMLGIALALRTCLLHFMGRAKLLNLNVAADAH